MDSAPEASRPFHPRYRFRWAEQGSVYELVIWPDDRHTLEERREGASVAGQVAIDAARADALIRQHGLRSTARDDELRTSLREAFARAAEGMAALEAAERQIEAEMRRRRETSE